MRSAMRFLVLLLAAGTLFGQSVSSVSATPYKLPDCVRGPAEPFGQGAFDKLPHVGLEATWAAVTNEGYPQCFINELHPLIGGVTIIPGDFPIGEDHGILVIPASVVNKVLQEAMGHDQLEEFQR
jgi:hypothetical protein